MNMNIFQKNFHHVCISDDFFDTFIQRVRDYGPIFRIWTLGLATVELMTPEDVEVSKSKQITIILILNLSSC